MLLEVTVRLTSPLLGSRYSSNGVRQLSRTHTGLIATKAVTWNWAFKQAFESLKIKTSPKTIKPEIGYRAPAVSLYVRKAYVQGKAKDERFESVAEGKELVLCFALITTQDGDQACSLKDFTDALAFIGRFLGISHYGNDLDFGRFDVVRIQETNQFNHEQPTFVGKTVSDRAAPSGDAGSERPFGVPVLPA